MKEYELYVPLHYNDGSPVEPEKLAHLRQRLFEYFGGFTDLRQQGEGLWKLGNVTFRDEIVIYRVLADQARLAQQFLMRLKEELKRDLGQQEFLIVERMVEVL